MRSIRLLLHALDRTGPPMLGLALVRWLQQVAPEVECSTVAFRGGPLDADYARLGPVHVMLEDGEAWDHADPSPTRVREVVAGASHLPAATVTLLVSIAGGQCLPYLRDDGGPVAAWVVEQGEDLHWIGPPLNLTGRVDHWLAGSEGTAAALRSRLGPVEVRVAPEFVEVEPVSVEQRAAARRSLGIDDGTLFVAGAGIGTWRKAPDLFMEAALAHRRAAGRPLQYVWFGGQTDPLIAPLVEQTRTMEALEVVRWEPGTDRLVQLLAAADVFVHPARLDAFPLVCLHAALCGTPVVAFSGAGGVPEMFGPHFAGVRYPDVHGLAGLVHELDSNGALPDLGGRQREHVRSRFTSETAAPALLGHLRSLLDAGHRPSVRR